MTGFFATFGNHTFNLYEIMRFEHYRGFEEVYLKVFFRNGTMVEVKSREKDFDSFFEEVKQNQSSKSGTY